MQKADRNPEARGSAESGFGIKSKERTGKEEGGEEVLTAFLKCAKARSLFLDSKECRE